MTRFAVIAAVVASLFSFGCHRHIHKKPFPLSAALARCVSVKTFSPESNERTGGGSGINFGNKLVLSAYHLVKEKKVIRVSGMTAEVVKVDADSDLVLLRVENMKNLPPVSVAKRNPAYLDEVIYVGNPGGLRCAVVTGKVVKVEQDYIWIDAVPLGGFSGSAFYNEDGELFGVGAVGTGDERFGIGFSGAIPLDKVREFLKDVDLESPDTIGQYLRKIIKMITAPLPQ